jgi:hypothetical protein
MRIKGNVCCRVCEFDYSSLLLSVTTKQVGGVEKNLIMARRCTWTECVRGHGGVRRGIQAYKCQLIEHGDVKNKMKLLWCARSREYARRFDSACTRILVDVEDLLCRCVLSWAPSLGISSSSPCVGFAFSFALFGSWEALVVVEFVCLVMCS